MGDEKDEKLTALINYVGADFTKVDGKYQIKGADSGATDHVERRLISMGLANDKKYYTLDKDNNTIQVNPASLPDPKGNPYAYFDVADHNVYKNARKLSEATGIQFYVGSERSLPDDNQYSSGLLTEKQLNGLEKLGNNEKTRPVLKALFGDLAVKKLHGMMENVHRPYVHFTPNEFEKNWDTISKNKVAIQSALGTKDDKLAAFNRLTDSIPGIHIEGIYGASGNIANNIGGKYVATFGEGEAVTVGKRLKKLGLKEGSDFKILDAKSGKIEISPAKLPDPKGDLDVYKKLVNNPLHASMIQAGDLTSMAVPHHEFSQGNGLTVVVPGAPAAGKGSRTV